MKFLAIVAMTIVASVVFGLVHDQVTIRISLEYFTIAHPDVGTKDPTQLALIWGVLATWWMGLLGGVLIGAAARLGSRPKVEPRALIRPILWCLAAMAVAALVFGVLGYQSASQGAWKVTGRLHDEIPKERHVAFLTAAWAHGASYAIGSIGILVIAFRVWRRRGHEAFIV